MLSLCTMHSLQKLLVISKMLMKDTIQHASSSYMLVIKVQFENHRSGRTLSSVYPSFFLFFSKSALNMSSRSDTWFRRRFWFELPHGHTVCAKNTLLKEGELQSIDGIQRKQCRRWWRAGSKDVQNEHHINLLLLLVYCIHILQLYWAFPRTVCHWFKCTALLLSWCILWEVLVCFKGNLQLCSRIACEMKLTAEKKLCGPYRQSIGAGV